MEGQPTVSYRVGSMDSLCTKLKNLGRRLEELHEEVVRLKEDFFDKLAGRRDMNMQVRAWMGQVRELVFDIEDWVDQRPAKTEMWDQWEIEGEVSTFKAQIKQARELCTRYNLVTEPPTGPDVADGPSIKGYLPCPFEWRNGLLALEDSKSYLEESLKNGEMKLKVVSIVGMEGCGKTSLAKEIYGNLRGQFDCHAFVSVGRRPSVRATLLNILRQVKPGTIPRHRRTSQDMHKVITELWEYLGTKRYFILVDGLWSTQAWKVINCALPDKNRGSRVLTTTCIIHVAKSCSMHPSDVLYEMKALREDDSRKLFHRHLVRGIWTYDFPEVFAKLLKICDGMPLAIIVAAGLFSGIYLSENYEEPSDKMKMVVESILSSLEQYSTSEGMTKILDMSYADLSLPMKSCLLYLSIFPEDYTINKDRLIRLWLAEGFIPGEDVKLLWVTGERYFEELIIRGLIQPVFDYDDDKAVGCTVHGVILDFVRSLSSKENFVTVGSDLGSGIFPCSTHTVRRFSLDCCNNRDEADILASSTVHLLRMRSLTVFGDIEERAGRSALMVSGVTGGGPVLPAYKLIRVLDLEDADNLRSYHLKDIQGLVLLKYLGLRGTDIDELPKEIGELGQLEMLDVRQTKLTTLPPSIVALKRLVRLLLDGVVMLPFDMSGMDGLEEISTIGVHKTRSFLSKEHVARLLRWHRLKVLSVSLGPHSTVSSMNDFLQCLSIFPQNMRKFELTVSSAIPEKVVRQIPSCVTHLHIEVTQLEEISVVVLGELPNLVLLKLVSSGNDIPSTFIKRRKRRCVISGEQNAFRRLKVFWFTCKDSGRELQFGSGAMPQLRRLRLCLRARETLRSYGDFKFGIQHLTCLTRVHATISCEDATVSEVENAEDAIREQARETSTTIEFSRVFEDKMHNGERNMMNQLKTKVKRITSLLL